MKLSMPSSVLMLVLAGSAVSSVEGFTNNNINHVTSRSRNSNGSDDPLIIAPGPLSPSSNNGLVMNNNNNNNNVNNVNPPALAAFNFFGNNNKDNKEPKSEEVDNDTSTTSTNNKILVKPRPTVSLDDRTQTYVRPDPNLGPDESESDQDLMPPSSGWDNFKDSIYGAIDTFSGTVVEPLVEMNGSKVDPEESVANRKAPMAYSSTVETDKEGGGGGGVPSILPTNDTPGNKLLRRYEQSLNKNDRSGDYGDLYTSEGRKVFEAAKGGVYDGIDAVFSNKRDTNTNNNNNNDQEMDGNFKAKYKPSINQDETLTSITPYLSDLSSSNPLTRLKAKITVAGLERKRERRENELKRRRALLDAKENLYTAIDTANAVRSTVATVPERVVRSVEAAGDVLGETSVRVQDAVEDVRDFPGRIGGVVKDVSRSVEETKEISAVVAEDIRNIPSTIEGKINETKRSVVDTIEGTQKGIKETQQSWEDLLRRVEDLTYDAKVLAGMEKPRPTPPPPPPPPKTGKEIAQEIAVDVAKTTATVAGKGAWVVAKGSAGMLVSGAKLAGSAIVNNVNKKDEEKEKKQSQSQQQQQDPVVVTAAATPKKDEKKSIFSMPTMGKPQTKPIVVEKIPSPPSTPETIPVTSFTPPQTIKTEATLSNIDPLLDKEVSDALRLAEEALAEVEREKERQSITNIDINEAVLRAKQAAAKAAQDAADLQILVSNRRKF